MTVADAARDAATEALDRHFSDWHYTGEAHDGLPCAAQDVLAAALPHLTPEDVPHIAAQVLHNAADDWRDDGRGVMFNQAGDDLTPQQRVGKWLRVRAERIALDAPC